MTGSQRRNARYGRILGVGLAISLAVHVAVLGFVRFRVGSDQSTATLTAVTLEDRDVTPDEWTDLSAADAPATAPLSEISPAPDAGAVAEYMTVLALATERDLPSPLVPQPRLEPVTVESGLTPIHVLEPIALGVPSTERLGRGGVGFTFVGLGGDRCVPPRGGPVRFPPRRLPLVGFGSGR